MICWFCPQISPLEKPMLKSIFLALAKFFARKTGMVVTYHWRTMEYSDRVQKRIASMPDKMPAQVIYEVDTRGAALSESDRHRILTACYDQTHVPLGADYSIVRDGDGLDYKGQALITVRNTKNAPPSIELANGQLAYLRDTHG